jgi:hypothetical protein
VKSRVGDVSWVYVTGAGGPGTIEGSVDGRPLTFFPYAAGWAALAGFDLDLPAATYPWQIAVIEEGGAATTLRGTCGSTAERSAWSG